MDILTAEMLWEGYDPTAEQLETNVFKTVECDGLITKQLYFTGRTFGDGAKTRVFATVCYKNTKSIKPAVLLVGNYKQPINMRDVEQLAKNGFVTIAIDFVGRTNKGLHTIYAPELDYCNADVAPDMFYVGETARDTKLYEYALNCRRAITYLMREEKIKSVSLVTVDNGVYVGIIALGVDKRLTNGAILFGNMSRQFPEYDEEIDESDAESLNRHLEYDKQRQAWTLGLAPQTYAIQINIPLYIVNTANSSRVDLNVANKMANRLNHNCRYLILPNSLDYFSDRYFESLVKWLKGAQVPVASQLSSHIDANGDYCLKVQTSSSINKTSVWYCSNPRNRAMYWRQAKLVKDGAFYIAKLDLYERHNEITAYALFDRDVAISTQLFKDTVTVVKPKIVNKNIFSGQGEQKLIRLDIADSWLNLPLEQQLTEGYLGIVGAKGKKFATFAIADSSLCKNGTFTLGFDICSNFRQKMKVVGICGFGDSNLLYCQTTELIGDGKWQRVTVDKENFRRVGDDKQISEEEIVDMIVIAAEEEIIVNNIFLV